MAVAMKHDLMPGTEIGSDWWQAAHQRLLDQETFDGLLASGAMDANAGFLQHPTTRLLVQIGQIAEAARGQEVALHILHPGLNDPLLLRIRRRTRIDFETVTFGALGIGSLDE